MTFTIDPLLTGASRAAHAVPATASARTSAAAEAKKSDAVPMSVRRTALQGRKAIGWADASPLPAFAATPLHSPRHVPNRRHPVPSTTATASTRSTSWTALSSNRLRRQWELEEGWQSTAVGSEGGEGDCNAEAEEFVSSSVDRDQSNEEEEETRRRADRRRSDTPLRRPPRSTADVPNPFSAYAQGLPATTAGMQTPPPPRSQRLPACFSAFTTASAVAAAGSRSGGVREGQPPEQFFDNPLLSATTTAQTTAALGGTTPMAAAAAAALSPRTPAPRLAVQLTESCRSPRNEEAAPRRLDRFSSLPTRFPAQVGAAADADTPLHAFTSLSALSHSSRDFSLSGYEAAAQQGGATREAPRDPSHYFEQVWSARRTQHVAAAATTTTTASAVASSSSTAAPQPYAPPQAAAQHQRPSFLHPAFGRAASVLGSATNATTSAPALPPFAPPRTPQRATLHTGRLSAYSPPMRLDVHALGRAAGAAVSSAARSPRQELFIDEYDDTAVRQTTAGGHEGDLRSRVRPRGIGATDPSWWQPVRELTSAPNLRFSSAWRPPFPTLTTTTTTAATTAANRSTALERDSTFFGRPSASTDQPYGVDAYNGGEDDSPPLLRREAYRIPAYDSAPHSGAKTQAVWPPPRRTEGCRTTELRGAACRLSLGGPFAPSNHQPQDAQPYAPEAPPSPPHARWQELSSVTSPPRPTTRFGTSLTQSILGRRPPLAPQRGSRRSGYVSPHRYASHTPAFRPYSVAAGGAEEERRRQQQQRQRKLDSYQHNLQEHYLCGPMPKRFCFEKPPLHPVEATAAPSSAAGRSASNGALSAATTGPRTTAVPSCVFTRPAATVAGSCEAKRTVLPAAVNTPLSEAARAYSLGIHPSTYASTATAAGSSEVPPLLRASGVLGSGGAAGGATKNDEARAREQATREACMDARQQVETLADGDAARHLSSGVNVSFTLRDIAAVLLRLPLAKDDASGGLEVLDICAAAWRTAGASCFVSRKPTRLQGGWERYLERINVNQKPFYLRTQAIILVLPVPHVPALKVCVAINSIHDVLALVCQEPLPRLPPSAEEAWRGEDRFELGGEKVLTAMSNAAQRATGAATEMIEERRWLFGLFTTRRIVRDERSGAVSATSEQRHPSSPSSPTAADRSDGARGDTAGRKQTPAVQRQKQMDALCLTWRHRLRIWYALFQAGRSCESLPACTSPLLTDPDACRARCALLCNRIAAYATVRHRLETLTAIRHAYEEHRADALSRQRVRKLCDAPFFSGPTLRLGEAGERHGLRGGNAEAKGTAATNFTAEEGQRTRLAHGGVAFAVDGPPSSIWAALHGAQPPSTSGAFSSRATTTTVSPHTYCVQGGLKEVGNTVGSRAAASTRSSAPLSSESRPSRFPAFSAAAAVNAGQPVQPHLFTGTASSVAPYASGSSLAPVRAATAEQQLQSQQPTDALSLARATADSGSTATARLALRAAGAGAGGVGASSTGMDVLLHLDRDDTLSSTLRRLATVCTPAAVPPPLTAVLSAAPRSAQPVRGVREDAEASTGVLGSNATSDEATPLFAGFVPPPVEVQPRLSPPFDISVGQVQQLLQWQWEHHQHSYHLLPLPFFRGSVIPSVDFALFSAAREQASSSAYVSPSSTTAAAAAVAASPYAVSPLARELLVHLARWGWLLPLGVHRSNRRSGNHFLQPSFFPGSRRHAWWRIAFLLVGLAVAVERPGQCLCLLLGMGAAVFAYNGCCTGLLKPLPTHRSSTSAVVDGSSEVEWRPRLFLLCGPRLRLRRLWGRTAQRQAPRLGCRRCASCPPSLITHDVPPLQQRVSLLYSLSEATSIDQQERRAAQSSTQAVVALALRWQTCAAALVSRVQLALCGYSTTLSFYIAGLCLAYLLLYLVYCAVVQRVGRCVASVFAASWSEERSVLSTLLDTTADLLRQGLVNSYAFSRGGDGGRGGRWSAPVAQQTPAAALWDMSEAMWRDVFESVRFLLLQRLQRATADAADDHVDSAAASGAHDASPERVNDGAGSASGRPSYFYQNGRYYAYDAEPPAWAQAGTLASSSPSGATFTVPATTTSSSGSSSDGAAAPTFTSASARLVHSLGDWVAQVVRGAGGEGGEEFPLPPTQVRAGSGMHAQQQQQQSHAVSSPPVVTVAVSPTPPTTNASGTRTPPLMPSPLWASNSCEPNILWFIVLAYVVTACLPRSPFRWLWRRVWVVLTHDDALVRRPLLTV